MARRQDDYAELFRPLGETFNQIRELGRQGPADGSDAARDAETEFGRLPWTLAQPAAAIGLDHLVTWQHLRLACGFQPTFAHLTLIRSAIEGMVVARWICEPNIETRERIQRAVGAQIEESKERVRFEREDPWSKHVGEARTGRQRLAQLQEALSREQLKPIRMPTTTALFERYVGRSGLSGPVGESVFRVLSSIAHAKVWCLLAISELGMVTNDTRGHAVATTADERIGLAMTAAAMSVAADVLADLTRYASS